MPSSYHLLLTQPFLQREKVTQREIMKPAQCPTQKVDGRDRNWMEPDLQAKILTAVPRSIYVTSTFIMN